MIAAREAFGQRVSSALDAAAFLPFKGQTVAEHRET
jgi:hypothetical protein